MPKKNAPPIPKRKPDDTVAFNNANDLLESMGVTYKRKSDHHLRIGSINYYPNTGTIYVDGEKGARSKRGKQALCVLLSELRLVGKNLSKSGKAQPTEADASSDEP